MSNEPYLWRVNVGNTLTVGRDDEITLPPGYYLEEAQLLTGKMKAYLMSGEKEIASWYITKDSPPGNDILKAIPSSDF